MIQTPYFTYPPLVLKPVKPAQKWSDALQRINENFDQIYTAWGQPKGEKGNPGPIGPYGATGVGIQGVTGDKGSIIWYEGVVVVNNSLVSNINYREHDTVIDNTGAYYEIKKDVNNDLYYSFQINLTSLIVANYFKSEKTYYNSGLLPNSINHLILNHDLTSDKEENMVLVRRTGINPNYDSEYYRLLVGLDKNLDTRDLTSILVNIPSTNTLPSVESPGANDYYQQMLKYRPSYNFPVSFNGFGFKYREISTGWEGIMTNADHSVYHIYDPLNPTDTKTIQKTRRFRVIGNDIAYLSPSNYYEIIIDSAVGTINTPKLINENYLLGQNRQISNPTDITGNYSSVYYGAQYTDTYYSIHQSFADNRVFGSVSGGTANVTITSDVSIENVLSFDRVWQFRTRAYFRNKIMMDNTSLAATGSSYPVPSLPLISISAATPLDITNFTGVIRKQIFTITATDDNVSIDTSFGAIFLDGLPLLPNGIFRMIKGESLTFIGGAGSTAFLVSHNLLPNYPRRFYANDIGDDMNNLIQVGVWRQVDNFNPLANFPVFPPISPTVGNYTNIIEVKSLQVGTTPALVFQNLYSFNVKETYLPVNDLQSRDSTNLIFIRRQIATYDSNVGVGGFEWGAWGEMADTSKPNLFNNLTATSAKSCIPTFGVNPTEITFQSNGSGQYNVIVSGKVNEYLLYLDNIANPSFIINDIFVLDSDGVTLRELPDGVTIKINVLNFNQTTGLYKLNFNTGTGGKFFCRDRDLISKPNSPAFFGANNVSFISSNLVDGAYIFTKISSGTIFLTQKWHVMKKPNESVALSEVFDSWATINAALCTVTFGAFSGYSSANASFRYKIIGKTLHFNFLITGLTASFAISGRCSCTILIPNSLLPQPVQKTAFSAWFERSGSGSQIGSGRLQTSGGNTYYSADSEVVTSVAANGAGWDVSYSGTYEINY